MHNLFFSSRLPSSSSTCMHDSIYNSYNVPDGISLLCMSLRFQFPTFLMPVSTERTLRHFYSTFLSLPRGFYVSLCERILRLQSPVKTDIALSTTAWQLTSNVADNPAEIAVVVSIDWRTRRIFRETMCEIENTLIKEI